MVAVGVILALGKAGARWWRLDTTAMPRTAGMTATARGIIVGFDGHPEQRLLCGMGFRTDKVQIEFLDAAGVIRRVEAEFSTRLSVPNNSVLVHYDPSNPEDVAIEVP